MPEFHTNLDMHTANTKHKHDLHVPNANLNSYKSSVPYKSSVLYRNPLLQQLKFVI